MKNKGSKSTSRREFLTAVAMPVIVPSTVLGKRAPSDRVHLAAFGVGGRGSHVTGRMREHPDAQFVAVCDCYESRREKRREEWNAFYGGDYVKAYSNPYEVMAREDIDAAVIATPDHWHTPLAMAAARAGLDMYVEKPLSVAMKWSWRLRKEFEKRDLIFQYGTQQRSDKNFRYACELARNGYLGEVQRVHAWCPDASQQWKSFVGRPSLSVERYGSLRPVAVPKGLDYDLWCGPSPVRPYTVDRCTNFGAYHIYDHALGFIAGWGAHPLDIAQWGLDADNTGPVFYEGTGKLPEYGLLDTTEEWDITCYYKNGAVMRFMDFRVAKPVVMEYRERWSGHGTTFFGTEGWVSVDRGGFEVSKPSLRNVQFSSNDTRLYVSDHHQKNFVDCVKSRKQAVSGLETAIRSDTISHLSDMVVRLRRPLEWDPEREEVVNEKSAARLLDRTMRKKWAI